jgi:succinyl-CoA synthetase alpha subunit
VQDRHHARQRLQAGLGQRRVALRYADLAGGKGDAGSKTAAMEAAGIKVSPARLGKTLVEVLKG